jgi:hypothetical protein
MARRERLISLSSVKTSCFQQKCHLFKKKKNKKFVRTQKNIRVIRFAGQPTTEQQFRWLFYSLTFEENKNLGYISVSLTFAYGHAQPFVGHSNTGWPFRLDLVGKFGIFFFCFAQVSFAGVRRC